MASNADHFIRALTAPPTRLSGAINSTSVNIGLESLEGIQSDTAVVMTIDRVDADGKLTPELTEVVLGTLGNNGLENVVRGVGGKKQAHKSGAVVEVSVASSEQWNRLVTALLKTHNQDGTLKEIDGSKIKDSSLDGSKIKPSSVKPEHTNFPRACYGNETTGAQHASGAIIKLRSKIHSNTTDIELQSNSSFKIKKSGLLRLSFNLWIHGSTNSRPWINVIRYRGSANQVVADVIDDSSSGYVSLSLSNFIISVQANDVISITCNTSGNEFYLDGNSGRANSQALLELI